MKIMVTVKPVIDPYVKIRIKADGSGLETQGLKMVMNPFDEIAVEEALRLKEQGLVTEVVAVSIGKNQAQETLRHGLALGADRAILVSTEESLISLNVAKVLQKIVAQENPDLVLMGKQAIDGDNNQTPQMLAALLNWPQATYASKIVVEGKMVEIKREIDGGLERVSVNLPAVVSVDLRLNEPRYASLPNIMKAKSKPLSIIELSSLGLELNPHVKVLKLRSPVARSAGIIVDSVATLIDKLKNEAKVL